MRRRILLLVVGMTALVVLAFAIPLAVLIRNQVYDNAVKSVQDETNQIGARLGSRPSSKQLTTFLAGLRDDRRASVVLPTGRVLGDAPPGGTEPVAPGGPPGGPGGPGQQATVHAVAGGQLSELTVPTPGGAYVVRVYASDGTLHSGETGWWLLLGGASVGLLLVGVLAAELLTRRIVAPLVHTADTARRLAAGDAGARAPITGPAEVAEVGVALNRLGYRIDQLIAEERETVADLSHRLRTPLTAMRLDAEALRDPTDAERMGAHVGTLERMLTAVIHAARRPQREGRLPSCDAAAVVAERYEFWSALAEDQGRAGELDVPDRTVPVRAGAEDLGAAVDALLENVFAHTPEGTAFAVRLTAEDGGGAWFEISDAGPGLPDDAPVRGRSDRGSSGLGLDIARRCAEASGGSLTLGAGPDGGASVRLLFGAP